MRPAPRRPTVGGSAFASKIERLSLCNSPLKRLATPYPCGARSPDKKESQLTAIARLVIVLAFQRKERYGLLAHPFARWMEEETLRP